MKIFRTIPAAFNRPMTMFGFPTSVLLGTGAALGFIIVAPMTILSLQSKLVCLLPAALVLAVSKVLMEYDPRIVRVFFSALRHKAAYVRTLRTIFQLEVKL